MDLIKLNWTQATNISTMSEATAVDHITVRKVHPERAIAARQSDAYHRRASRVYLVSKQEENMTARIDLQTGTRYQILQGNLVHQLSRLPACRLCESYYKLYKNKNKHQASGEMPRLCRDINI